MEPVELLRVVASKLERLGIRYLVVGSTASAAFGEPRYTNDIDIVVDLPVTKVAELCAAFEPAEYYVSIDAALDAVGRRSQFNVIHPQSGLKVDFMVASESDIDRSQLQRGVRVNVLPDFSATFASPEDVILKKMEYCKEGGSEKHLRDIAGILRIRGDKLDRAYIADWAGRLRVSEIWQRILDRLNRP